MVQTEVMTTGEVAAAFAVFPSTVVRWADRGLIPSFRTPGGHRRFNRADIEKLLAGGVAEDGAA